MPHILTTEYIFNCPHKGVGTFPTPQQRNWKIGSGWVLLDGDTGVITGCTSVCCLSFSVKSLGLTAVQYESKVFGRKFAMLTTDLILSNCGFPMEVLSIPPFKLTNTTVPLAMLVNGKPPEFLDDETKPNVAMVPPKDMISWKSTEPQTVKYSIGCKHLDETAVDVRLIPQNAIFAPIIISKLSPKLEHYSLKVSDQAADQYEIEVRLTNTLFTKVQAPMATLLVRVCSKRGVSNYSEVPVKLIP